MYSEREVLIDALDALDAGYRGVATYPVETLSRTEGRHCSRLDALDQKLVALQRKVSGRLVTMTRKTA